MRRQVLIYVASLAALAFAIVLRAALHPYMGESLPLVTLFGAIAASSWMGGYRPAILVTLVGYPACAYLFVSREHSTVTGLVVGLVAYLFTSALIIAFGQAVQVAQARTNQQSELFRVTLGSIGDAVVTTDVRGRVTYMNAVAETLTGWTSGQASGHPLAHVFRIVNEETRDEVEDPATRALREGTVVGLANHTMLIARDGTEWPIDDSAAPIRDEDGNVAGCVLIFREVTAQRTRERERSNQLLAARLLAAIVESSDDAIISKTLDGTIQSWNAAAERVFGHSAEEAVGKHISLVIPPERIQEEAEIIAQLQAGRRIEHFETVRVRADGGRILVSLTISPIKDDAGNVVGASKIARDVTRQRQAEEREHLLLADAAEANAKFRALFDQGAIFAAILDGDGKVLEINRMAQESAGCSKEEIHGRRLWETPCWSRAPAAARQMEDAWTRAVARETAQAQVELLQASGAERMLDLTIQPVLDDAGNVRFVAVTGTDVTERRRAELRLADADRRKDEFLAMLAHELRNPLAPISNAVQVLGLAERDPVALRAARETLERQVGQMGRLVDDLLDVSRVTRGRIELRRERIDLAPVVRQAVEATHALYESMGQELSVDLPRQPIHVEADPARIAQVIGNLLNNACKYTDKGGHIRLSVAREGADAVLRVKDDGIGIDPAQIPRLFEMFNQVESSLERSRGGLGIGLTLARTLVEMHGGTIVARSEGIGKGSEFVVRLPVVVDAPRAAAGGPKATAPVVPRRVLVVDDNEDGAASMAMLLRLQGHETHVAHDGEQAIVQAERLRPDVVLLDIGLPAMNGYEACRRIRASGWGQELMLIAVTGWGQDEDLRRSREAGFDAHLVKPVPPDALARLLSSLPSR